MTVVKVQTAVLKLHKFNQNGWGVVYSFVNSGCVMGAMVPEAIFKKLEPMMYTVKHTYVHDMDMDMSVKEEHVKIVNLLQKKYLMSVIIAPQSVKSQHHFKVVNWE